MVHWRGYFPCTVDGFDKRNGLYNEGSSSLDFMWSNPRPHVVGPINRGVATRDSTTVKLIDDHFKLKK